MLPFTPCGPGTGFRERLTFLLGVGVIIATVVGTTCYTNAHLDELRDEIAAMHAEITTFIAELRDGRLEVGPPIRDLRQDPR